MLASRPTSIIPDNQTLVTNITFISALGLGRFMIKNLPNWTVNRKNAKILIICGAHGDPDGSIKAKAEDASPKAMKDKWIKDQLISEDQVEVLDIFDYIKGGTRSRHEIEDTKLVDKVRTVNPGIIAICVCYSHLSQIHLILSEAGILSVQKLERDLQLSTKGRCISLDETQRKLLFTVSESKNITKNIIIHGPEGSGKTILALEVVKMKLSHYLRQLNMYGINIRKKIKVIICGSYSGEDRVPALLKQLYEETKDIKDHCEFELKPINDMEMSTPKVFQKKLKEILDFSEHHTIVMIDELFPGFTTDQWKDFKGIEKTDFVFALRHAFNDGVCLGKLERFLKKENEFHGIMEQQGVYQGDNVIFCHLRMSYRCTQQLIDLVYYMLIHSPPEDKLYKNKSFIHLPGELQGRTPLWLEVPGVEAFIEYSNTDADLKDADDVMVIYDPNYEGNVIQTLRGHCVGRHWKVRSTSEVMGSEASTVVIFDLTKVHFEAISRAVNHLIFVTTQKQTSLKGVLKDVIEKRHDANACKQNWKDNGKYFNQKPQTCTFFSGAKSYNNLLLHKKLDASKKDDLLTVNEYNQRIAQFRLQLAIWDDLKDEVSIGCRNPEDNRKHESQLFSL